MGIEKSNMTGMVADYQAMYDAIRNWNEASLPSEVKDGKVYNEPGHYIYGMGWAIGDAPYHGWTGENLDRERHLYEEVKKAHKALKVALQNALGYEQREKEY